MTFLELLLGTAGAKVIAPDFVVAAHERIVAMMVMRATRTMNVTCVAVVRAFGGRSGFGLWNFGAFGVRHRLSPVEN